MITGVIGSAPTISTSSVITFVDMLEAAVLPVTAVAILEVAANGHFPDV